MATILERFNHLGLASSKPVLSKAGEVVVSRWIIYANTYQKHSDLNTKTQKENSGTYEVNDYPEYWTPEVDRLILQFVNLND